VEGKQTGCYPDSLTANPNRPTAANPADITQYGVLELEDGFDRVWNGVDERETSFGGLLKFDLCDVELRWNTTSLWQTDGNSPRSGVDDNWLGPQVRIRKQTQRAPTLAFSYSLNFPSASADAGLGTERVDHAFSFLASKHSLRLHIFGLVTRTFQVTTEIITFSDHNLSRAAVYRLVVREYHSEPGDARFCFVLMGTHVHNQSAIGHR